MGVCLFFVFVCHRAWLVDTVVPSGDQGGLYDSNPTSTEFLLKDLSRTHSMTMTSNHTFMHHHLSYCYTDHSKAQRNVRMAENVEITTESASPLEKDFVLKKIKEYENFVKLKLEPKIQDLEKSKVE